VQGRCPACGGRLEQRVGVERDGDPDSQVGVVQAAFDAVHDNGGDPELAGEVALGDAEGQPSAADQLSIEQLASGAGVSHRWVPCR